MMESRRPWFPGWVTMALLLLITFLVFSVSLRGSFQFDDNLFLRDPNVRSPSGWSRMHQAGWTRWLSWLTFYWNFRLAGENPFWYHFVNSSLHLINVVLVSAVVRASPVRFGPRYNTGAMGGDSEPRPGRPESDDLTPFSGGLLIISSGTIAAAIFAVHPLQTEAVDYIYQRAVLLAAAFGFSSLYLFFRFLRGDRVAVALAIPLLALAILSKESALGFVPIFFMACASSRPIARLHPYLIAIVGACVLVGLSLALRSRLYLFTEALVFWRYLSLFFYPRGLNIDHDVPLVSGLTLPVILSILAIGGLVFLFIALADRYRPLSFWFFS